MMSDYVDQEDAVVFYYDTEAQARRERDRFYGPAPSEEDVRTSCEGMSREETDREVEAARRCLPPVQRSKKRPGKWFVRYGK